MPHMRRERRRCAHLDRVESIMHADSKTSRHMRPQATPGNVVQQILQMCKTKPPIAVAEHMEMRSLQNATECYKSRAQRAHRAGSCRPGPARHGPALWENKPIQTHRQLTKNPRPPSPTRFHHPPAPSPITERSHRRIQARALPLRAFNPQTHSRLCAPSPAYPDRSRASRRLPPADSTPRPS